MSTQLRSSKSKIQRHWHALCRQIGHRTAGSRGERRAADYIEDCLHQLKLDHVGRHSFDFPNWASSACELKAGPTRPDRSIRSARASVYSVSTPPAGVRGPLAYLQSGSPLDFAQPLKGRIGLLIGSLALADENVKRRLMRSGLKALVNVDTRVPFAWPTSNGSAPQWVRGFRLPMAGIAYLDAIRLVEQIPLSAHLTIEARRFPDTSHSVMGEVVGRTRPEEVILVSGHHDCVDENVGADDNGSGVIFMLELARLLSRQCPRRTVRFISYGVEERLSVGSYQYMMSLTRAEQRRIVLAVNADSVSSAVGTDDVLVTATPDLDRLVRRVWQGRKHAARISSSVHGYSDHFPFNIAGVPSVSLGRRSIEGGSSWQLHSRHDNLDHVSADVLARTIDTAAVLLNRVAGASTLPFRRSIAPKLAREVATFARDTYRHPWSAKGFDYNS